MVKYLQNFITCFIVWYTDCKQQVWLVYTGLISTVCETASYENFDSILLKPPTPCILAVNRFHYSN